jgi:predicted nucleic acid-binding Zn ribbon protein
MRKAAPRSLSVALDGLAERLAPSTTLARVQERWEQVAGAAIAAAASPTAEHDGVLTITCEASVWAQELDLMAGDLVPALNSALGAEAIRELRCRTA